MFREDYHADKVYLSGLKEILCHGVRRDDRTGTGTIGMFGQQQRYDLQKTFPLLVSKKMFTRGIVEEMLWILRGETNNNILRNKNVHIWDEWADENGELGPVYGHQWRNFNGDENNVGVDQIRNVLESLRNNPYSRRHLVSAWNPQQVDQMALPPCHTMFQFYVTPNDDGEPTWLSCQLYQRSRDTFLGAPFNIASYSMLTVLFADWLGYKPLHFIHATGDAHIYLNHVDQVEEQLSRLDILPESPTFRINHPVDLDNLDFNDLDWVGQYSAEDFIIENYNPLPAIKAPVSV